MEDTERREHRKEVWLRDSDPVTYTFSHLRPPSLLTMTSWVHWLQSPRDCTTASKDVTRESIHGGISYLIIIVSQFQHISCPMICVYVHFFFVSRPLVRQTILAGRCPVQVSIAVLKHQDQKSPLGREGLSQLTVRSTLCQPKNLLSLLSLNTQDHQTGGGTAHSELGPLTSNISQRTVP